MSEEEPRDPLVDAIGLVLFGVASSVVSTLDDEDVERFRSAYQGFLEGANADAAVDSQVLEIAGSLTEMFEFSLRWSLDDPSIQADRRNLREELQESWREELREEP